MTEVDDRIEVECCDCGTTFLALGEWQVRCRVCYAKLKGRAAPSARSAPVDPAIQRVRQLETSLASERRARAQLEARLWSAEAQLAAARKQGSTGLSRDDLRRIRLLVHPDKHAGSDAAHKAFLAVNRAMG